MIRKIIKLKNITTFFLLLSSSMVNSAEFKIRGVVDIRLTANDTINSYRNGGYGKFDLGENNYISLAQGGLEVITEWDNGLSSHIVANAYSNKHETKLGLTEAFLKYTSLPNKHGYRWQSKLGIFYPEFSLENNAIAWASPNTLNFSTINTWIGEEIRVLGNEYTLTRLGKYNDSNYDLSITGAAFINNEPAGSLLAWHGWTVGNRQTLWTEKVTLPPLLFLRGTGELQGEQSQQADPFYRVNNKVGWYGKIKAKWRRKGEISLAYYDNRATPYIIRQGQYGWRTKFYHLAAKWHFSKSLSVYSQFLRGDTLMQNHYQIDIVNNDYQSAYIALSKRMNKHKFTLRLEEFSVADKDNFAFDNNEEYGKSGTLNYTYRLNKSWFISTEYSLIKSERFARIYAQEQTSLTEQQLQLAARYFF